MWGQSTLRCTLYRRQTDVSCAYGMLGHRDDVFLTTEKTICRECGIASPPEDYVCTPKCAIWGGGAHFTADKQCKQWFQLPYVVRRRRERQRSKSPVSPYRKRDRSRSPSRGRFEAPRSCSKTGHSRSTERSRSRRRSRSKGPPAMRIQEPPEAEQTTDHVGRSSQGTYTKNNGVSSTPPEHSGARIVQLERENASLRNAFEQLKAEIADMKRAGKALPAQRPFPPETEKVATPMEPEVPVIGKPAKKKYKPIRHEGFDALRTDLREFQSELRTTLEALSEAVSALNARVHSVESNERITANVPRSFAPDASPLTDSSRVMAALRGGRSRSRSRRPARSISHDRIIEDPNHGGTR
ncbi:hypothetical protein HPB48_019698 [Haemaphysalis longicornis]|uniref:Uncharacterized protein n=1 Tax=Haemaphysalis longicornis TaxID=44386 RepID=A0A9J6G3I1_HAELO|nr:hypothetical protein HPB48_019698 [Haemaphysalis longicornis]